MIFGSGNGHFNNSEMVDIDLTYLNEISGGDKEFIDEMIQTFLEETPKELVIMEQQLATTDWVELSKTAHKLKSSIKMFGMNELRDEVLHIEQSGKNSENLDTLGEQVVHFMDHCREGMDELRKHL